MNNTISYIQYTKSLGELNSNKQLLICSDFGFIIDNYNGGNLGEKSVTEIKIIFDIFNCKDTGIEDTVFIPKIEYSNLFKEFVSWLESHNIESGKYSIMKEGDIIIDRNREDNVYFPEGSMRFHRNCWAQDIVNFKANLIKFWYWECFETAQVALGEESPRVGYSGSKQLFIS